MNILKEKWKSIIFHIFSILAQIGVLTYVIKALKYNFYCIEDIGFNKFESKNGNTITTNDTEIDI